MPISQDNIQPVMVQNSQHGSAEGDEHLPDGMGVLSDFDFSEPESVAQVSLSKKHPQAESDFMAFGMI
jgi:hypothetical protein